MNIYFVYNKNEIKFEDKVCKLKEYIKENQNTYKIKFISKLTNRKCCDIYVILSDQLDEINEYLKKVENKEKVLIVTSNIIASHILACIELTNNITYLGNDCDAILKRINSIYEKTKDK